MRLRPSYVRSLQAGLVLLLFVLLALGAFAGITYWAWQSSLPGVVLSALLLGFGASALVTGQTWRSRLARG